MKKFLLSFLLLAVVSCSGNEDHGLDKREIRVQVYYKLDSFDEEMFPDVEAKVFVYYELTTIDFMYYEYQGNGVFTKRKDVITPDQTAIVDRFGNSVILPEYTDKIFTIVIESHFYTPRLTNAVYPSVKGVIEQITIFEP